MNHLNVLIKEIASQLKASGQQLVTAESCTGGLIAAYLTEIPGSSIWFERGFVTYSNLAKHDMLAVPGELLAQFGAVSEEVASAMAVGALRYSAGHIAVSVTGIAGPDGGSIDKPVGTVCFGWVTRNSAPLTLKMQFAGTRHEIREAACRQALEGVLSLMKP
ncbi:CinA family protein [Legionella bononiensis]|uniref:CinA family protein n=1 Tax=Legionella bononiensis TaxID=2793102 RepID=A0ABS1WCV6_9GAMM|nr:CinA family protein [Legionella bononiensis]MBL7527187.1 CinA family protein [Legionella bononiensis]MBL7562156.1 CinA family protein [Legionella bononiensis]